MCGIVGGKGKISLMGMIDALERLEYRGYDSCGVGFKIGARMDIKKSVGYVENLRKDIPNDINADVVIGHTRWATHGSVSENNTHPHVSDNGCFAIVHNGIIENYRELKDKYLGGVGFRSETDSEVIAQLLSKNYRGNVWESFKATVGLLRGTFAIVMMNTYDDIIYFARQSSPLVLGKSGGGYYISSDANVFDDKYKICYLDDESIGYIDKNVVLYDKNYKKQKVKFCDKGLGSGAQGKGDFSHFMLKEIYDIPDSLRGTMDWIGKHKIVLPREIDNVLMVSCGTSYHSSLVGKKYIEDIAKVPVQCEIASEYIYSSGLVSPNTLGVFISQSGETADTITALKSAKKSGIYTLAITNVLGSTITQFADEVIYLNAGCEICVASTKAYVCQVLDLLLLSNMIASINAGFGVVSGDCVRIGYFEHDYLGISHSEFEKLFCLDISQIECEVDSVCDVFEDISGLILIGKDFDYVTVKEGALKVKEVGYLFTDAYPSGELKHGTLSLIDEGSIVIAVATEEALCEKVCNAIHEITARGGRVVKITQLCDRFDCLNDTIIVSRLHRLLMPMVAIIPLDILAYKISIARGNNPDKPRNLAKSVTVE